MSVLTSILGDFLSGTNLDLVSPPPAALIKPPATAVAETHTDPGHTHITTSFAAAGRLAMSAADRFAAQAMDSQRRAMAAYHMGQRWLERAQEATLAAEAAATGAQFAASAMIENAAAEVAARSGVQNYPQVMIEEKFA